MGHVQDISQICRVCLATKRKVLQMDGGEKEFFNLTESEIYFCSECKEQCQKVRSLSNRNDHLIGDFLIINQKLKLVTLIFFLIMRENAGHQFEFWVTN